MIKISVITVCRNAEADIRETMESVFKQSYENLEYIICDGASTDNTLKVIQEVAIDCQREVKVYSEQDSGIYNAMNRGISRVTGEYVIFMNAGDKFNDLDVLKKAAECIRRGRKDIYYGCVEFVERFGLRNLVVDYESEFPQFESGLLQGRMPCHQGIIASAECLRKHPFKEQYQYRADFDWLVYSYKQGAKLEALDFRVAKYDHSGFSSRVRAKKRMKNETQQILEYYYPIRYKLHRWKKRLFDI